MAAGAPEGQDHTADPGRDTGRDRVVTGLKVATAAACAGLAGVVYLLVGGSREDADTPVFPAPPDPLGAVSAPARSPEVSTGGASTTTAATTATTASTTAKPTSSRPSTRTPPPAQDTKPAPTTTTRPTAPPGFALEGDPCSPVGSYAVATDYRPLVCKVPSAGAPAVWHSMFTR